LRGCHGLLWKFSVFDFSINSGNHFTQAKLEKLSRCRLMPTIPAPAATTWDEIDDNEEEGLDVGWHARPRKSSKAGVEYSLHHIEHGIVQIVQLFVKHPARAGWGVESEWQRGRSLRCEVQGCLFLSYLQTEFPGGLVVTGSWFKGFSRQFPHICHAWGVEWPC
jgi:hypothetical protein